MRLPAVVATTVAAFAAIAVSSCHPQPSMSQLRAGSDATRATLITLDSTMNAAVDNLDCAKGLSYIGDEQPLFISGGHVVETHEQLLAICKSLVAPRTGAQFVPREVTAHLFSPDAGYVVRDGEYIVHLRTGQTTTEHLAMTTIWVRQNGQWTMVHLHESAIRP